MLIVTLKIIPKLRDLTYIIGGYPESLTMLCVSRKVHSMDHRSQLLIIANFVCVRQSKAKMYRIDLSADVCRLPKHVLLINTINI